MLPRDITFRRLVQGGLTGVAIFAVWALAGLWWR
jgi:hypothetical protein